MTKLSDGLLSHTGMLESEYVPFDVIAGIQVYTDWKGCYKWEQAHVLPTDMNVYINLIQSHMNRIYG